MKSGKSRYKIIGEIIAVVVIALLLGTANTILASKNYVMFLPHIILLFISAALFYVGERKEQRS